MAPMEEDKLREVFFPHAAERVKDVLEKGLRFAYYTNAETAFRIIKNKEIWMRGTSTMNDYLEVEHGFECLNAAYKSEAGARLRRVIDSFHTDLSEEILEFFNGWLPDIRNLTFIVCLSEHPAEEDQTGRLSMWRAYGGKAGVAIVVNASALFLQAEGVGVFASPVAYWTQAQVEAELARIAERLGNNADGVRAIERERLRGIVFSMFRFAVLCTKHPGFAEEREWRVIASPRMYASPLLTPAVEVIGGVPQPVQKLHLADIPERNIVGLALPSLVNRLILGPCDYPLTVLQALRESLRDAGVPNPDAVIHVSDIPLRANH